jgi:formate dehydrogenase subunit gamma
MVAATIASDADRVARFDAVERAVHWISAALVLTLIATGAVLYLGPLSAIVGRRPLVREIHVWVGLGTPVPFLMAVAGRRGAALRRDLRVLNRFDRGDWTWLRAGRRRRVDDDLGKFNPGQKLNAAFVAGAVLVMLGTGSIMKWFAPFPDDWRTGATFVHDWTALALGLAITGHVLLALGDRDALRGMWSGWVPAAWARRKRPRWLDGSRS